MNHNRLIGQCLVFSIFLILTVPLASGFEFDNVKQVKNVSDSNYPEVTIKNAFGLGDDLVKLKIVEHTERCAANCYSVIEISSSDSFELPEEYSDTFGFEFINLKTNRERTVSHSLSIATGNTTETRLVGSNCTQKDNPDKENKTKVYDCWNVYENASVYAWKTFDWKGKTLPSGHYWLKIHGSKSMYDSVDYIPSFLGKEIPEMAKWLNVNTAFNYTFDSADFNNTGNNSAFASPPTPSVGTPVYHSDDCIDGGCLNVSGTKYTDNYASVQDWYGTVSMWLNSDIARVGDGILAIIYSNAGGNNVGDCEFGWNGPGAGPVTNGTIYFTLADGSGEESLYGHVVPAGVWFHVAGKSNASGMYLYHNGTRVDTGTKVGAWFGSGDDLYYFFNTAETGDVSVDEFKFFGVELSDADILQLYQTEAGIIAGDTYNVTLNSPADNLVSTSTSFDFNCTAASTATLTNNTLQIWRDNGTIFYEETANISGNLNESIFSSIGTFDDDGYVWNCFIEDSNANSAMASSNFTLTIDTTSPVVSIVTPTTTYYNQTNISFTFNTIESNLDSCGYYLNGGTRVALAGCVNSSINGSIADINNLTIWINDTAGQEGISEVQFGIFNVTSIAYTTPILELDGGSFYLNMSFDLDLAAGTGQEVYPNVTLFINGSHQFGLNSSVSCTLGECSSAGFTSTFTTPLNTTASNYSFWFNISLPAASKGSVSLTSASFMSATNYLEVPQTNLVPCLANDTTSFNITCYDENTRGQANCTLDYDFELWSGDRTLYKVINGTSATAHQHYLCIQPVYGTLYMDGLIEFDGTNYELRNYWFTNQSVTNTSVAVDLYNMNSSLSTLFEVSVQDENFEPAADRYVRMMRYYPELNSYLLVEIAKTNFVGDGVLHIYKDNPFYRFFVYDYITLTKEVEPFKPVCSALPCELLFIEQEDFENLFSRVDGVDFNLSWNNNTETFRWTFSDSGGSTTGARLIVEKYAGFGMTSICDSSLSAASGTVLCDVSGNGTGTYLAKGYIEQTNEYVTETLTAALNPNYKVYAEDGMFWSIMVIIVVSILGLAFSSVMIGFILPIVVLIVLSLPQIAIISIPMGVLVGLLVFVMFILVKARG